MTLQQINELIDLGRMELAERKTILAQQRKKKDRDNWAWFVWLSECNLAELELIKDSLLRKTKE